MIVPDEFLNKRWYIQGFNATPNLVSHATHSALKHMWVHLGFGYGYLMNSCKEDFCEYYYDRSDFESIEGKISENLKKDPRYIDKLESQQRKLWEEAFSFAEKTRKTDLKKLSKKELIELYSKVFYWYCETVSICHLIEAFILWDERLSKKISESCSKLNKSNKLNAYLAKLTQSVRSSYTNEERINLLKILKIIKSNPKLEEEFLTNEHILEEIKDSELYKLLEEHKENFYWVKCNYAYGEETTISFFVEELKELLKANIDPNKEILEEENKYELNKEEKKKTILELNIHDPETLLMIKILEQILHFQDDRKKTMMLLVCSVCRVLYEIAERYNIKKRLILYLSAPEIKEEILSRITAEELQERKNGCIFLWKRNNEGEFDTLILVGNEYLEFVKKLEKKHEDKVDDFRGMCASTGIASGKVRICRTKEDLDKFEKGEILVASMTRPEFVTAMRRAAAIVTDEGGVTCHAAIIARELKIPCVIGTKIATKILNNGDYVEVRANHGLVKILKK